MPFVTGVFDSWAAKAHSCILTVSCLFPWRRNATCRTRCPPGSCGWGLVTGWVLWPSMWLPSLQIVFVFICPTFCTGSCCQPVNQVDGWSRLEGLGKWQRLGKASEQRTRRAVSSNQNLNIAPLVESALMGF